MPRRECENDIKMNLKERFWHGMDWISLAQERDTWLAVENMVTNL